jgi:hypothetical protein
MNLRRLAILCCALSCVAGLALVGPSSGAGAQERRQTITATVVGISGRAAGRSRPFRLVVENYTSPAEVQTLNDALQQGGQDRLRDALDRMDAGRISVGNGVGVTANAVIRTPTAEGGTRLTVLFRRNINFFELRYGARSQDYQFGYAEIFLDGRGRGEGTFIPAAKVRLRDGNTWEVEDFGVFPARLIGVRSSGNVPAR